MMLVNVLPERIAVLMDMLRVSTHLVGAYILPVPEYIVELIMTTLFNLFRNNLIRAWHWALPESIALSSPMVVQRLSTRVRRSTTTSRVANNKSGGACRRLITSAWL